VSYGQQKLTDCTCGTRLWALGVLQSLLHQVTRGPSCSEQNSH